MTASCVSIICCSFVNLRSEKRASQCSALAPSRSLKGSHRWAPATGVSDTREELHSPATIATGLDEVNMMRSYGAEAGSRYPRGPDCSGGIGETYSNPSVRCSKSARAAPRSSASVKTSSAVNAST